MEEKIIKLQIWDTAGQESFRSITRIFYRGAHCVFLTYDITRDDTFVNVIDWLKEIKQHATSDIVIYLIGNRSDLEDDREVTRERAIEFCKQYNIDKFFETSAKTGDNVEEVFSLAAKELFLQSKDSEPEGGDDDDSSNTKHTTSTDKTKKTGTNPNVKIKDTKKPAGKQGGGGCC